jgi:hypothetical protein
MLDVGKVVLGVRRKPGWREPHKTLVLSRSERPRGKNPGSLLQPLKPTASRNSEFWRRAEPLIDFDVDGRSAARSFTIRVYV